MGKINWQCWEFVNFFRPNVMIKYLVPRISQEIFVFPSEYFICSMFHALFWRALWLCEVKAQAFYMPQLPEGIIFQETECSELPLTQKEFSTSSTFPGSSPQWLTSKPLQQLHAGRREPSHLRYPGVGVRGGPHYPAFGTQSYTAVLGLAPNWPIDPEVPRGREKAEGRGMPWGEAHVCLG